MTKSWKKQAGGGGSGQHSMAQHVSQQATRAVKHAISKAQVGVVSEKEGLTVRFWLLASYVRLSFQQLLTKLHAAL